jgi:hypothetical protein
MEGRLRTPGSDEITFWSVRYLIASNICRDDNCAHYICGGQLQDGQLLARPEKACWLLRPMLHKFPKTGLEAQRLCINKVTVTHSV